ncbi:pro-sigmaK processing inhibitor BofA family protein [Candidatus Micrarchaeota archaeon]|nr:pro-sigmaK processing inhibitor BofA family protein [Candidatus Micrarchaeota archaeon]
MVVVELFALLIAVLLLYLFFKFFKTIVKIILNSIVGIVVLFLLNFFFDIPINIFSILIVALAGFPGVLLILILHFLGIAF